MSNPTRVEIFPPIGISRAGDSSEWYYASEDPIMEHVKPHTFRGEDGKIKRSAVKFHAYLYNKQGGLIKEATAPDYTLKWNVNVANKKAAWVRFRGKLHGETFRLRNPGVQPYNKDHGPSYEHTDTRSKLIIKAEKPISGKNQAPIPLKGSFTGSHTKGAEVTLGEIQTDDCGRLVFLAGTGESKCVKPGEAQPDLLEKFDKDDWYDTMCDGNVTVTVTSTTGLRLESKLKAVVIGAPPKFTSGLHCPTSLYDLIEDIYERPKRASRDYEVDTVYYDAHIRPIFDGVRLLSWTNQKANEGHGPLKGSRFTEGSLSDSSAASLSFRTAIFERVRAPIRLDDPADKFTRNKQAHGYYMPALSGNSGDNPETMEDDNHRDRWTSLTELQYDRLAKWAKGEFTAKKDSSPSDTENYTLAALKWTTGAPVFPGIEMYWIAEFSHMYDLRNRFRFHNDVEPGDLTKGLSLPWQADFYMWPHTRPDDIVTEETWKKMKALYPETKVPPEKVTERDLWDEGLTKDDDDERIGNTEMVRKWGKLGYISTKQINPDIYVETERLLPRSGEYSICNVGQNKCVGQGEGSEHIKSIVVVNGSPTWNIEYIKDNLYYMTIANFTIAAHEDGQVKSHEEAPTQQRGMWIVERGTWVINSTPVSGYKIHGMYEGSPKFWTLDNANEDTQVKVAVANGSNENQIWKFDLAS